MSINTGTALVTGAAGFIGSHLVERLLADGIAVRAMVRYNSSHRAGWLDEIAPALRAGLHVRYGDIRDAEFVSEAARGCDVVYHLAALISIPYSYDAPQSYVDTNVTGTLNVLQAARRHGGIRVIQTSTSEVYGTPETVPIVESHPLRAQSPYAATKVGADQLALAFHRSFGLPVVVLRPFNTYGPRQSARAVLPAILTQLLSGAAQIRLGSLWPRRDLTYVTDTADGFVRAAAADGAVGETVQLGTGRDVSIGELVELAQRVLGTEVPVVADDARQRPEKSEVHRLLSSPARAADLLGWRPTVSLEDGLARTIEWLRPRLHLYRPEEYLV